ncbi:MAG: hypothetical protein WHT82_00675 [Limisphaera sp.]
MCRVAMLVAARWCVWAGLAWIVAGQELVAQPVRRGPPIQFSEPQNDLLVTNANRLPRRDQPRPNLSEELQRRRSPLQELGDPLRPSLLPRPPAGPMIQSARVRELLERQRLRESSSEADPLNQLQGMEGQARLNQNPLEPRSSATDSPEPTDPRLWTRFAEELEDEQAGGEAEAGEPGHARADPGAPTPRRSPEAAATEARVEQLEKALRQGGESSGLLNLLPGLERSFWDGPMTTRESDLARAQARSREDRLERFRAGLEAITTAPEGGLDPMRIEGAGQPGQTGTRSLALPTAPMWMETPSATAGAGQPATRSPGLTPGGASPSPGWGASGNTPALGAGTSASGSPLGGTVAPPVTRPSASPALRGPKMPSPFTEIPKRPGI